MENKMMFSKNYYPARCKWKAAFAGLPDEELMAAAAVLSDMLIIPNWFDRATLAEMFDEPVDQAAYDAFRQKLRDYRIDDEVSDRIFEIWHASEE
jgi:aspartate/methionine/tyrosine aminotransferase